MAQTTTTNQTTKSNEQIAAILNITAQEAEARKQAFLDKSKTQNNGNS